MPISHVKFKKCQCCTSFFFPTLSHVPVPNVTCRSEMKVSTYFYDLLINVYFFGLFADATLNGWTGSVNRLCDVTQGDVMTDVMAQDPL